MGINEILEEMKGQPIPAVIERLATELEKRVDDVPLTVHLQAMGSALLLGYSLLARDLAKLMQATGLDVDPEAYAAQQQGIVLLRAQMNVFLAMTGEGAEVVDGEIETSDS